jgi:CBS domain containing-hemolysin-like protein
MLVFLSAVAAVLVVSFLCSIFESVLLSINRAQVESLAHKHERAGRLLADFKQNIDIPIAAILILNTAAHTVGAAVAGATYQEVFSAETLWLFTIVFTIAVLLFTEIIPKTLGVTNAMGLARPVAYGIYVLTFALRPLVLLSERISRMLRGSKEIPVTSIEEIRLLTALGRNEGVVGVRTAGMIEGAARLRQLQAGDVMVPRNEVIFLTAEQEPSALLTMLKASGHSRFPISSTKELQDVFGIVLAKELLFWLQEHPGEEIDWKALAREPLFIHEAQPLNPLLREFQEGRRHMALVVNEYGEVQGIVTLEDVLEEIVGNILDESDRPMRELWPQEDGSLHARATVDLRRVCTHFDIEWSPHARITTLGGLMSELLGRLPRNGDVLEWNGLRLEVLVASERRAELIALRAIKSKDEA